MLLLWYTKIYIAICYMAINVVRVQLLPGEIHHNKGMDNKHRCKKLHNVWQCETLTDNHGGKTILENRSKLYNKNYKYTSNGNDGHR